MPSLSQEELVYWYVEGITAEEYEQKVHKLRAELEAQKCLVAGLDDRLTLLRFLKARQWSVHKAAKMYQAMAFWRDEQQVDQLLSRYQFRELPEVRKHYPHFYHKTDRWGRPLYIELLGKTDVDALMKVTTMERFVQYHIQQCESFRKVKLPACSAAAGRTILTTTIILDLAGLSPTRHFTLTVKRFLETVSLIDQDYFPEHLGCMFIINTPLLFRSFWSVVKGFLDERTLAKIKVLGSSYKPELLEVIPVENLPNFLGGTSVCTELIDVGPWQDATIVAGSPALLKAGAAGQLGVNAGLPQSDSFEELNHRSGMIGTSVEAA